MKIELWPESADEIRVVIEAMVAIQTLRDEAAAQYPVVRTPFPASKEVPEDIEADDMVGAGRSSEPSDMPPPASIADATTGIQSALGAGVPIEAIIALLAARKVARVTELDDVGRTDFVVELRALEQTKRGAA